MHGFPVDGPDSRNGRPSGNLCFIGMLTFWLLLYENFRPEGVVQSFCELDFSLPLTEALGKESTNKYCLPFSGQCVCKWSHLKKTNQKWILTEISESFFPAQKLLGLGMWMLFFVCLQHHHCNQKHVFSEGNLWYVVTKQDFQVQISCEMSGLGRRDCLHVVAQARFQLLKVAKWS